MAFFAKFQDFYNEFFQNFNFVLQARMLEIVQQHKIEQTPFLN